MSLLSTKRTSHEGDSEDSINKRARNTSMSVHDLQQDPSDGFNIMAKVCRDLLMTLAPENKEAVIAAVKMKLQLQKHLIRRQVGRRKQELGRDLYLWEEESVRRRTLFKLDQDLGSDSINCAVHESIVKVEWEMENNPNLTIHSLTSSDHQETTTSRTPPLPLPVADMTRETQMKLDHPEPAVKKEARKKSGIVHHHLPSPLTPTAAPHQPAESRTFPSTSPSPGLSAQINEELRNPPPPSARKRLVRSSEIHKIVQVVTTFAGTDATTLPPSAEVLSSLSAPKESMRQVSIKQEKDTPTSTPMLDSIPDAATLETTGDDEPPKTEDQIMAEESLTEYTEPAVIFTAPPTVDSTAAHLNHWKSFFDSYAQRDDFRIDSLTRLEDRVLKKVEHYKLAAEETRRGRTLTPGEKSKSIKATRLGLLYGGVKGYMTTRLNDVKKLNRRIDVGVDMQQVQESIRAAYVPKKVVVTPIEVHGPRTETVGTKEFSGANIDLSTRYGAPILGTSRKQVSVGSSGKHALQQSMDGEMQQVMPKVKGRKSPWPLYGPPPPMPPMIARLLLEWKDRFQSRDPRDALTLFMLREQRNGIIHHLRHGWIKDRPRYKLKDVKDEKAKDIFQLWTGVGTHFPKWSFFKNAGKETGLPFPGAALEIRRPVDTKTMTKKQRKKARQKREDRASGGDCVEDEHMKNNIKSWKWFLEEMFVQEGKGLVEVSRLNAEVWMLGKNDVRKYWGRLEDFQSDHDSSDDDLEEDEGEFGWNLDDSGSSSSNGKVVGHGLRDGSGNDMVMAGCGSGAGLQLQGAEMGMQVDDGIIPKTYYKTMPFSLRRYKRRYQLQMLKPEFDEQVLKYKNDIVREIVRLNVLQKKGGAFVMAEDEFMDKIGEQHRRLLQAVIERNGLVDPRAGWSQGLRQSGSKEGEEAEQNEGDEGKEDGGSENGMDVDDDEADSSSGRRRSLDGVGSGIEVEDDSDADEDNAEDQVEDEDTDLEDDLRFF